MKMSWKWKPSFSTRRAVLLNFLKEVFLLTSGFLNVDERSWAYLRFVTVHYCDIYFKVFDFEMHSRPVGLLWLKAVVMTPDIYPRISDLAPCFLLWALNLNPTLSLSLSQFFHTAHTEHRKPGASFTSLISSEQAVVSNVLILLPISMHWTKSKHTKSPVSCNHFLIMKESCRGHKGTCVTHRHVTVRVKLERQARQLIKSGQINMSIQFKN